MVHSLLQETLFCLSHIEIYISVPGIPAGKESACNAGDLGLIPGLGKSPGEGNSYPLQYSDLENPMDCIVHRVTKCWIQQSNFHFIIWWKGHDGVLQNSKCIRDTVILVRIILTPNLGIMRIYKAHESLYMILYWNS